MEWYATYLVIGISRIRTNDQKEVVKSYVLSELKIYKSYVFLGGVNHIAREGTPFPLPCPSLYKKFTT